MDPRIRAKPVQKSTKADKAHYETICLPTQAEKDAAKLEELKEQFKINAMQVFNGDIPPNRETNKYILLEG